MGLNKITSFWLVGVLALVSGISLLNNYLFPKPNERMPELFSEASTNIKQGNPVFSYRHSDAFTLIEVPQESTASAAQYVPEHTMLLPKDDLIRGMIELFTVKSSEGESADTFYERMPTRVLLPVQKGEAVDSDGWIGTRYSTRTTGDDGALIVIDGVWFPISLEGRHVSVDIRMTAFGDSEKAIRSEWDEIMNSLYIHAPPEYLNSKKNI